MSDGESMAEKVTGEDHLVLIELGGNDLIAGNPPLHSPALLTEL